MNEVNEINKIIEKTGPQSEFPELDPRLVKAGVEVVDVVDHERLEDIQRIIEQEHPGHYCNPEYIKITDPSPLSEQQVEGHVHRYTHNIPDPNKHKGVFDLSVLPILDLFKNGIKSITTGRGDVGHTNVNSLPLKTHQDYYIHEDHHSQIYETNSENENDSITNFSNQKEVNQNAA